ncbi:MAG: hypothetical protein AAGF28_11635 [Pseudomonadota bacterium]
MKKIAALTVAISVGQSLTTATHADEENRTAVNSTAPWATYVTNSNSNTFTIVDLPTRDAMWWEICRSGLGVDADKYTIRVEVDGAYVQDRFLDKAEDGNIPSTESCLFVLGKKIRLSVGYKVEGSRHPQPAIVSGTYRAVSEELHAGMQTRTSAFANVTGQLNGAASYEPKMAERRGIVYAHPKANIHSRICSLDTKSLASNQIDQQNEISLRYRFDPSKGDGNFPAGAGFMRMLTGHKSCIDFEGSTAIGFLETLDQIDGKKCNEFLRTIRPPVGQPFKGWNCSAQLEWSFHPEDFQ